MRSHLFAPTSTSPGVILVALCLGAIVSPIFCFILIRVYKNKVTGAMKPAGDRPRGSEQVVTPASERVTSFMRKLEERTPDLLRLAEFRLKRLVLVYSVAGLCSAGLVTAAFLLEAQAASWRGVLIFFVIYTWPVLVCWNQVAGWHFHLRWRNNLMYFALFAIAAFVATWGNAKASISLMVLALLLVNVVPALLISAFTTSAIKSIGPCVWIVTTIFIFGVWTAIHTGAVEQWAQGTVGALPPIILTGIVSLGLGWFSLSRIAQAYAKNKVSEQSIQIDSIWFVFLLIQATLILTTTSTSSGKGARLILLGFPVYWLVRSIGLRLIRQKEKMTATSPISLLYLRRFRLLNKTDRLFRSVTLLWRFVGEVRLIAGPDLARSLVQPHSLWNLLSGESLRLVADEVSLRDGLARLNPQFGPNTRYRAADFLCSDDVWKQAVTQLPIRSDVILADFRGFQQRDSGALFEVQQMLTLVPIERAVIVTDTDATTKLIAGAISAFARGLILESPNHPAKRQAWPLILQIRSEVQFYEVFKILFRIAGQHRSSEAAVGCVS